MHVLRYNVGLFRDLLNQHGIPPGAKVYAVVVDIFSTRDVCAICQQAITAMVLRAPVFLDKLRLELIKSVPSAYVVLDNLRFLPRVSSQLEFGKERPPETSKFGGIIDVKTAFTKHVFTASLWKHNLVMFKDLPLDPT